MSVRLVSGTAERDGTELALNHTYTFARTKSKLITYTGCALEVTGDCDDYVAQYAAPEDSPALSYLNLHFALHDQRTAAGSGAQTTTGGRGPRVMICGPASSGKTTVTRTLAALATRAGAQPLVANVDPREGLLVLPGTLSAAVFGTVMDIEDPAGGFGVVGTPSTGPSAVPVKLPIAYYFGREAVAAGDAPLWRDLVARLARSVRAKLADDNAVRQAGLLLDTPAATAGKEDVELLAHAAKEFAGTLSKGGPAPVPL